MVYEASLNLHYSNKLVGRQIRLTGRETVETRFVVFRKRHSFNEPNTAPDYCQLIIILYYQTIFSYRIFTTEIQEHFLQQQQIFEPRAGGSTQVFFQPLPINKQVSLGQIRRKIIAINLHNNCDKESNNVFTVDFSVRVEEHVWFFKNLFFIHHGCSDMRQSSVNTFRRISDGKIVQLSGVSIQSILLNFSFTIVSDRKNTEIIFHEVGKPQILALNRKNISVNVFDQ